MRAAAQVLPPHRIAAAMNHSPGVLAVQGFILALVGEYLGRIQRDVEGRPLYTIESELE